MKEVEPRVIKRPLIRALSIWDLNRNPCREIYCKKEVEKLNDEVTFVEICGLNIKLRWSYTNVDPMMREPVRVINEELGTETFASCEGHQTKSNRSSYICLIITGREMGFIEFLKNNGFTDDVAHINSIKSTLYTRNVTIIYAGMSMPRSISAPIIDQMGGTVQRRISG